MRKAAERIKGEYEEEAGMTYEDLLARRCDQRKSYRVGSKVSSWPKILTVNPYERPQVGPTFGPTLYTWPS